MVSEILRYAIGEPLAAILPMRTLHPICRRFSQLWRLLFVWRDQVVPATSEAGDFFTGLFETKLEDNELITLISVPREGSGTSSAYAKLFNPASRYCGGWCLCLCYARRWHDYPGPAWPWAA